MQNDWWWDRTWNPIGGCSHASPGCMNCYAQQIAGTYTWPVPEKVHHHGVTTRVKQRPVFNGKLTVVSDGHHLWSWPLRWAGAPQPCLGAGKPSLIFVGDMSDLFHENRPTPVVDRVAATIATSAHIGLLLTKRTRRMAEYFSSQEPRTVRRWQEKIWLGFSAERQTEFDNRWSDMRPLAQAGWLIFVSVAPMIGPVRLPPDFLALSERAWVIVAGEQGPHADCREMKPNWARAIRDQCAAAGIAFFMKQMPAKKPIPPDLLLREFPNVDLPGGAEAPGRYSNENNGVLTDEEASEQS
jgi:protein gp37